MVTIPNTYKIKVGSLSKKVSYRRSSVAFGDGYEQRSKTGINVRKDSWEITFTDLTTTTKNSLESILNTAASVDALDWIAPDQSVTRKWIASNVSVMYYDNVMWEISCTMTELSEQ
jgi:phage-related protein